VAVWFVVTKKAVVHLNESEMDARFHAGLAASKDEPHPQVRAAFGFTI
jgi:hypothetical protein